MKSINVTAISSLKNNGILGFLSGDISNEIEKVRESERKTVGTAQCPHAEDNYKLLKLFLKYVPSQNTYKTFSDGEHMDFTIEHLHNYGSIFETYLIKNVSTKNHDRIYDPQIRFVLDETREMVIPTFYENSVLQTYFHIFDDDYTKCNQSELLFADRILHEMVINAMDTYKEQIGMDEYNETVEPGDTCLSVMRVGSPFPLFEGRGEGTLFFFNSLGTPFLVYLYNFPTETEIKQMQAGMPFEIRLLEKGGILWLLSKCGNMSWTEAPYIPRTPITPTGFPEYEDGQGMGLTVILADARTGIIKVIRRIGLGTSFSRKFARALKTLHDIPMSLQESYASIENTMNAYSTKELAAMAESRYKSY